MPWPTPSCWQSSLFALLDRLCHWTLEHSSSLFSLLSTGRLALAVCMMRISSIGPPRTSAGVRADSKTEGCANKVAHAGKPRRPGMFWRRGKKKKCAPRACSTSSTNEFPFYWWNATRRICARSDASGGAGRTAVRRRALRLAQARAMASGQQALTRRARQTWPSLSLAGARAARHCLHLLGPAARPADPRAARWPVMPRARVAHGPVPRQAGERGERAGDEGRLQRGRGRGRPGVRVAGGGARGCRNC